MKLLRRSWGRYKAGKVLGHRNVRRCERCRGWHHRQYHHSMKIPLSSVLRRKDRR